MLWGLPLHHMSRDVGITSYRKLNLLFLQIRNPHLLLYIRVYMVYYAICVPTYLLSSTILPHDKRLRSHLQYYSTFIKSPATGRQWPHRLQQHPYLVSQLIVPTLGTCCLGCGEKSWFLGTYFLHCLLLNMPNNVGEHSTQCDNTLLVWSTYLSNIRSNIRHRPFF